MHNLIESQTPRFDKKAGPIEGAVMGKSLIRFETRQGAIQAISTAQSWLELFDAANQALRVDRRSWGDDEGQSAGAALIWAQMCFPVSAATRVGFVGARDKLRTRVFMVPGVELIRMSFELARVVATGLLAPLPPPHFGAGGRSGKRRKDALDLARRWVLKKTNQACGRLRASSSETHRDVLGKSARSVGVLEEALCGPAHQALRETGAKARARAVSCEQSTWIVMAESAGVDLPASTFQAACTGADVEAVEKLRADGGFALVSVGPMGGWGAGLALAEALAEGCRELGRVLGMPSQVAALGGMAALLNYHMDSAGAIFYKGGAFAMGFAPPLLGLAHEWSHALDDEVERFGDKASQGARADLVAALRALPRDEPSAERACAYDQDMMDVDWAALGALRTQTESEVKRSRALRDLFEDVRKLCQVRAGQSSPWHSQISWAKRRCEEELDVKVELAGAELIRAACGPWSRPDSHEMACAVVESILIEERRREVVRHGLAQGQSSFLAWARAQDWVQCTSYWSRTKELLARTAETYFADLTHSEALAPQDMGSSWLTREALARGAEGQAAGRAFGRWLKACRPWLVQHLEFEDKG